MTEKALWGFFYKIMNHYYTDNVDLISQKKQIEFYYRNHSIAFITDHGVFSKDRVDYGSHVLLEAIEINDEKSLLDIGCGYGAMGISLKKAYPSLYVEMIDINNRALSLAQENIRLNHLNNIISYNSYCLEEVKNSFDIIISNPPIRAGKQVVGKIIKDSYDHLNNQGKLVIVIQKKQGAPSAKRLMEETYGFCEILKRDKGYYILCSQR